MIFTWRIIGGELVFYPLGTILAKVDTLFRMLSGLISAIKKKQDNHSRET